MVDGVHPAAFGALLRRHRLAAGLTQLALAERAALSARGLAWAEAQGQTGTGLRLAGALWRFWYTRGFVSEGLAWCER